MKKIILLLITFVCIAIGYSQTTLSLCTYVSNEGYCAFDNNKFITTPDSSTGKIYMKVNGTAGLGTKLVYKIFTVDIKGEEKQIDLLSQSIQPDWFFAWMPNIFATNHKYNIQIFNDADKMLCSKSFELVAGSK